MTYNLTPAQINMASAIMDLVKLDHRDWRLLPMSERYSAFIDHMATLDSLVMNDLGHGNLRAVRMYFAVKRSEMLAAGR